MNISSCFLIASVGESIWFNCIVFKNKMKKEKKKLHARLNEYFDAYQTTFTFELFNCMMLHDWELLMLIIYAESSKTAVEIDTMKYSTQLWAFDLHN